MSEEKSLDRTATPVPQFGSMGQIAKDIFFKNYDLGVFKLKMKTKTSTGIVLTSSLATELDTFNAYGLLETNYQVEACGLKVSHRYDTKNILYTDLTFVDQIVKGSQLIFNCSYVPEAGTITSHVKSNFANDVYAVNVDVTVSVANPTVKSAAVLGYNGWLAGVEATLDVRKFNIVGNSFALGYMSKNFVFHTTFSDGTKFMGAFYQRMNPWLEIGTRILTTSETNETVLGIGCRYQLDPKALVCAKVNTNGQLGLAYQQKLQEGITLSLSGLYSINEFSTGGQRLGASLNFEF